MSPLPRPKLKKTTIDTPTEETRFHIDYGWWDEADLDLKTYLYSRLPNSEEVTLDSDVDEVDLVDMESGEVRRVDGFEFLLQTYFGQLTEDFVTRTPLAEAIFYTLLANANQPMTARELGRRVGRAPETVLQTVGGPRVYMGIRPLKASKR